MYCQGPPGIHLQSRKFLQQESKYIIGTEECHGQRQQGGALLWMRVMLQILKKGKGSCVHSVLGTAWNEGYLLPKIALVNFIQKGEGYQRPVTVIFDKEAVITYASKKTGMFSQSCDCRVFALFFSSSFFVSILFSDMFPKWHYLCLVPSQLQHTLFGHCLCCLYPVIIFIFSWEHHGLAVGFQSHFSFSQSCIRQTIQIQKAHLKQQMKL